MIVSTRGRYALRVMTDLALQNREEYIPMKKVAERQEISLKYLERILPVLTKAGLIDSVHGTGGGYRLNRQANEYTVWEILSLTEKDLSPVSCLEKGAKPCPRAPFCKTLPMWKDYYDMTKEFFSKITIADLANNNTADNYMI